VTRIDNPTRKSKLLRAAGLALGWASLALLPFGASGCHTKEAAAEDKTSVLEVGATSPVRKNLTREVQQPGWLRPYEVTPIYTKIAGFAKEPKYDIGDYVKKDATLVELFVPEVVQELHVKEAKILQADADLLQAKATADAAKAGMDAAFADIDAKRAAVRSAAATVIRWQAEDERAKKLVVRRVFDDQTADEILKELRISEAKNDEAKANLVSADANWKKASAHYEKTKADIKVAEALLKVAQADHDQKQDWLAYRYINAPYDGVVMLRNVHTGHFLQPSNSGSTSKAAEPLFMMMRTNIMRCVLDVPELDATLVHDGDKAVIKFDAMPGIETIAKVTRNANTLDERTRTLKVEAWLEPKGATIKYTVAAPDGDPKNAVVTAVDPIPPAGGRNYPRSATFPLLIAGGKAVVSATTNADGVVIGYALNYRGRKGNYMPGNHVGDTLCEIFRPFMYAHVTILANVSDAWTLPPQAVLTDILNNAGRPYCFVVEDGKAHKMLLQTGPVCNEGIQVLRKQRPGSRDWEEFTGKEIVVTTNTKALQDGQEVRSKAAEQAP
jgi:multidrug efflux pump subunit AcrA (membrane-fusion protein)